jgi:hypothetical protein
MALRCLQVKDIWFNYIIIEIIILAGMGHIADAGQLLNACSYQSHQMKILVQELPPIAHPC